MLKKFLLPVLFSLVSLVITLLVVEVFIRVILSKDSEPPKNDRPHRYYASEERKSLQDYFYQQKKPANTFRIIAIGDSFTFGFNNAFDDSWPKRLERMLNLNVGEKKVEVINFGRPGYSASQEVSLVQNAVKSYEPDLIILEVTLNDPETKSYRAPHGTFTQAKNGNGLLSYWKTFQFIRMRIANSLSYKEYIDYYNNLFISNETLEPYQNAVLQMKNIANSGNVNLVGVIFPLLSFPFDDTYPFFLPHKVVGETLAKNNIQYLDLFGAFKGLDPLRLQAVPPGSPSSDPHPNEIAHRIVAETLMRWLVRRGIIDNRFLPRCYARERLGSGDIKCKEHQ